jgi:hypothetical protein
MCGAVLADVTGESSPAWPATDVVTLAKVYCTYIPPKAALFFTLRLTVSHYISL